MILWRHQGSGKSWRDFNRLSLFYRDQLRVALLSCLARYHNRPTAYQTPANSATTRANSSGREINQSRLPHGAVEHTITTVFDLVVITARFALIFRYLPDAEITWR